MGERAKGGLEKWKEDGGREGTNVHQSEPKNQKQASSQFSRLHRSAGFVLWEFSMDTLGGLSRFKLTLVFNPSIRKVRMN